MANREERESTFTLKPIDFTPFIGVFIYQSRNWKRAMERGYSEPTPYNKYISTFIPLGIIDALSGILSLRGLASLLN